MNSNSRIQRLPIYTAILATVLVVPSLMDPFNLPKLWILSLGAGLICAMSLTQILNLWHRRRRSPLIFSGIFIFSLFLTSIASQQSLYRTLVGTWNRNNGTLSYLCLLVIFLSLASVTSKDTSSFLIFSLTVLGLLGATYGWMQKSSVDPFLWNNPGNKIILTLGNSNFASAFLGLTAIATLTYVLRSGTKNWMRAILVFSYLIQLYLARKSDAIQGLLVLLIGSAILFGLWLTYSNQNKIKRLAIIWWGLLLTTGFVGVIGLMGTGPLATLLQPNFRSLQDRYYHWIAAFNMLKDHLLFGVGIDSFGDFYFRYRVPEAIELRTLSVGGTNNAHNIFAQLGATGGLVLLLTYISLIIFTIWRGIFAFKKHNDKFLVSGVFSIWLAFQIQSLVSIDQIGLVVWGWASAGCLVALSYMPDDPKTKLNTSRKGKGREVQGLLNTKPATLVLIILGLIPSTLLVPTLQNELNLRNRLVDLISSNSDSVIVSNAKRLFDESMKSSQPELRLQSLQYLLQAKSDENALRLALETVDKFPDSFESWDALARIYESRGQFQEATPAREMTVKLDPLNDEIKKLLIKDKASN